MKYTGTTRKEVVAVAARIGIAKTAIQFAIHERTIQKWCREDDVAPYRQERPQGDFARQTAREQKDQAWKAQTETKKNDQKAPSNCTHFWIINKWGYAKCTQCPAERQMAR